MKRTWIHAAALAALLTGPGAGAGIGAESAGAQDVGRLGEVRGDTLFVAKDKVITAALDRNEMLAASAAMTDAAAAQALGAWRGFLPQIQLGEFFLRSDDALSAFGFKLMNRVATPLDFGFTDAGFVPGLLNEPGETDNHITRLQLMQPLFNGGMGIYGKQAANAASRAAEFQHLRAGETVEFLAVQAFEGLALAKAYEGVMLAAVASAEGHVRQAQSLVDNEMATEADLLQARVYLSGLKQRLIEVRNLIAVAGESIKLLTATETDLPLAADTTLQDEAVTAAPVTFDADGALERSDLEARRQEAHAAGKMVGVARGAMLPHLNLGLQKDYYSLDTVFGNDADSWSLGIYATWDVFKGLQNISELKKARAEQRAVEHLVDFETRQARVQATEAWLNVQAAHEKVQVARDAVAAAREGLRIVTNQYREGLAGMVDLLDTQAAATMAEGNLVQALHDYTVGLANLTFMGAVRSGAAAGDSGNDNPSPRPGR